MSAPPMGMIRVTPAIRKAPGVPGPLPRPRAIDRLPIIEASGAAAAITRKTMREVESAARLVAVEAEDIG